jgi:CrcB protein
MGPAFNRRDGLMAPTDERSLAMLVVIAVGLGGTAGALARYGLDRLIEHHVVTVFPWSTFTINITGCFLAGVAVAVLVDRHDVPAWVRTGVVVGFLGAYTTFSTFAQESRDLFAGGHASLAVVNASASVLVGILAVAAGSGVGRVL